MRIPHLQKPNVVGNLKKLLSRASRCRRDLSKQTGSGNSVADSGVPSSFAVPFVSRKALVDRMVRRKLSLNSIANNEASPPTDRDERMHQRQIRSNIRDKENRMKQTIQQAKQLGLQQTTWRSARARIRDFGEGITTPTLGLDAAATKGLFSPGIKGAYINKDGSCAKGSWESVGPRAASYMVNHIVDAIYTIAKIFCPKDARGLVLAVFNSNSQQSKISDEVSELRRYTDWSEQPLVQLLLQEHAKAKSMRRKHLVGSRRRRSNVNG